MLRILSLLALSLSSLATACTFSEPLDAQGTWSLQFTSAPTGTCFDPNEVYNTTMTARLDDDTYLFAPGTPEPGDTVTGTVVCTEAECDFDLTLTELEQTPGGASFTVTTKLDLNINEEMAISGTGNVSAVGGFTCSHAITIGGTVL